MFGTLGLSSLELTGLVVPRSLGPVAGFWSVSDLALRDQSGQLARPLQPGREVMPEVGIEQVGAAISFVVMAKPPALGIEAPGFPPRLCYLPDVRLGASCLPSLNYICFPVCSGGEPR